MAASQGAHGTGAERNPLRKVLFMLSIGLSMLCVYFCLDYQSGSGAQMSGELIVGKVDSAGYGNTDSSVTGFFFEHFGVLSYLFCFAIVYLGYFILLKPVDIWRADFFKGGLRILGFNCVLLGAAGILSRFAEIGSTGAGGLLGDMLNIFFDLFVPNILTVLTFGMVMVCGIAFMSGSTPFALFERVGELFFKVVPSGSERSKKRAPITDTENLTLDPALTGAGTVAALSTGAALASNAAQADDELSDIVSDTELSELTADDLEQADENLHPSEQDVLSDEGDLISDYGSDPDEIDTSKYDFSQSGQDGAQGGIEPVFGEGGILGQPSDQSLDPSFADQGAQPHDFFAGVMSALNEEQQDSPNQDYASNDYVEQNDSAMPNSANADDLDAYAGASQAIYDQAGAAMAGDELASAAMAGDELTSAMAGDEQVSAGDDGEAIAQGVAAANDPYADPANYDENGNYIGEYVDEQDDQQTPLDANSATQSNILSNDPYATAAAQYGADGQMGEASQANAYGQQPYADANSDVPPMPIPGDGVDPYAQQYATAQDNGADGALVEDDIMSADDLAQALSQERHDYSNAPQTNSNDLSFTDTRSQEQVSEDSDYSADAIANAAAAEAAAVGDVGAAHAGAEAAAAGSMGAGVVAADSAAAGAGAASLAAPAAVAAAMAGLAGAAKAAMAAGTTASVQTDRDSGSKKAGASATQAKAEPQAEPEHEMSNEEREALNESLRKVVLADVTKVKSSGDPYAIAHDRLMAKDKQLEKQGADAAAKGDDSTHAVQGNGSSLGAQGKDSKLAAQGLGSKVDAQASEQADARGSELNATTAGDAAQQGQGSESTLATTADKSVSDKTNTIADNDGRTEADTSAIDTSEDSPYGYGTYAAKHGFDNANEPVSPAKAKALDSDADDTKSSKDDESDKGGVHTIVQRTDPKVFAAQLEAQKKAREEKERLEREKAEQEKLEAEKKAAQEAEAKAQAEQAAAVAEAEAEKQALEDAMAAEKAKADKDAAEGPHYVGTYADDMDKSASQSSTKDEGPKYITPGVGGEEDDDKEDKEGPGTIIRDTRKEFEAQQAARAAAKAEQERLAKEAAQKEAEAKETASKDSSDKGDETKLASNRATNSDASHADIDTAAQATTATSSVTTDAQAKLSDKHGESAEDTGISTVITRTVAPAKAADSANTAAGAAGAAATAGAAVVAASTAGAVGAEAGDDAGAGAGAGSVDALANDAQGSALKESNAQADVFKALSSLASEIDSATADVKLSHAHDDDAISNDETALNDLQGHGKDEDSLKDGNSADAQDDSFKPEHAYDFADGHKAGSVSVDVDSKAKVDDEDDFSEFVSGTVNKTPNLQSGFNFARFDEKKEARDHIFSEESSEQSDSTPTQSDSTPTQSDSNSGANDNIIAFDNVKSFEVGGLSSAFIPMPGEESAKVRHSLKDDSNEQALDKADQEAREAAARALAEQEAREAARVQAEQEAREAASRAQAEQEAQEAAARAQAEQGAADLLAAQRAAQLAAAEQGNSELHAGMPAFGQEQPMADQDFSRQTYANHVNPADITRGFNFNQFEDNEEIEDGFGSVDSSDVFNHSGEDSLFGKFDIDDDVNDAFGSSSSDQDVFANDSNKRAGFGSDLSEQKHHRAGFGHSQMDDASVEQGRNLANDLGSQGQSASSQGTQSHATHSDLNAFITDEDSEYEDEEDSSDDYSSDDDYETDESDDDGYDDADDNGVDQSGYINQSNMQQGMQQGMQQNLQQMMPNNYQAMQNPMQPMQGIQSNMPGMPNQQMQYMQLPNGQFVPVMPNGMMYPNAQQGMMPNMPGMAPNPAMGQMGVNPMGQYMQLPNGQFVQVMPNNMPVMPNGMNPMGMMQPNQMQANPMQQGIMPQQGMMYGNNMGMNPQVNAMQPNAQGEMQQEQYAATDNLEQQSSDENSIAMHAQEQGASTPVIAHQDAAHGAGTMAHQDAMHASAAMQDSGAMSHQDAAHGTGAMQQDMGSQAHDSQTISSELSSMGQPMQTNGYDANGMSNSTDEQAIGVNGYQGTNMAEAGNAFMGAHNSSSSNLPSYMAGVAQTSAPASFEDTGSKALCTVPRHRYDDWRPSLDLLARSGSKVEIPEEELEKTAERINEVLSSYGVKAQVADYLTGPVITRFDLELAPGVKSSAISSIETELCRNLLVPNVRVVPIIDGSSYVGLEVPNHDRQFITLADMASSREFAETKAVLPMCLGASVVGAPVVKDMAESPHLLVAGTTGSGKSAGLNTMLISMLLKRSPAELRLILVDPKQLEFSIYKDLPHLITPVITDVAEKTPIALSWCVDEMERRFKLMSLLGVRKLAEYNDLVREEAANGRAIPDPLWTAEMGGHPTGLEPLPWIVVVVEEFADLMAQSGRKKDKEGTPEHLIARLSAKSRAAGIHLVLVTQTPRSEVVTGMIKANFPSRVAFTVQNRIDSTIVLDEKGAECLLGNGDMLYKFTGSSTSTRAHGAFTSNDDVKAVVDAWREYAGAPEYLEDVIAVPEEPVEESSDEKPQKLDEKFDKAVELVRELGKAPTVSDLQSCLSIGYPRAKKLLRQLVLEGIID